MKKLGNELILQKGWGGRLKDTRTGLGLSQAKFAEHAGVSRATQAGYESEVTSPDLDYLLRIQTELGVSFGYITCGIDVGSQTSGNSDVPEWGRLKTAYARAQEIQKVVMPNPPEDYLWQLTVSIYVLGGPKFNPSVPEGEAKRGTPVPH